LRLTLLKKVKEGKYDFFWQQRRNFPRASAEEEGGRILLGDNISGGAVLLLHIRLQYAGIFIAIGLLFVNIYRWPNLFSTQT
jgi:hypothetical protein